MSSKTLLRLFINAKHVEVDATYKFIWHSFPVLILGSSEFEYFTLAVHTNDLQEFLSKAMNSSVEKTFSDTINNNFILLYCLIFVLRATFLYWMFAVSAKNLVLPIVPDKKSQYFT